MRRPAHYAYFAAFCAVLFFGTFHVAGAVVRSNAGTTDELPDVGPAPVERIGLLPPPEAPEAPPELPNLYVAALTASECLSSDPLTASGGTLDVLVRNDGRGRTGGFRLYIGTTTIRASTGASSTSEGQFWVTSLAPQEERVFTVGFSYPVHQGGVTVAAAEPLPGPYEVTASLDQPSELGFLGPDGVLQESNEADNARTTSASGMPAGTC